mmetsp:Transcript_33000/g.32352  ORF Transcript_33000/g.32352 Transcript_33000/m.32352 type:complete len:186 (+) Transcript_33000:437-994(+)
MSGGNQKQQLTDLLRLITISLEDSMMLIKSNNNSTSNFKQPVQRKIYPVNLYDPHRPVSPKEKLPGPGHYNTEQKDSIQQRTAVDSKYLNSVKLSSAFMQENTDRFGKQIYPTTEMFQTPGPDHYNSAKPPQKNPSGYSIPLGERERHTEKVQKEAQNIGPGAYNSNVEPKKISFFLNQGNKWVS